MSCAELENVHLTLHYEFIRHLDIQKCHVNDRLVEKNGALTIMKTKVLLVFLRSLDEMDRSLSLLKSKIYAYKMLRNLSYFEPKRSGMRVFKLCWYLCFLGGGSGSL